MKIERELRPVFIEKLLDSVNRLFWLWSAFDIHKLFYYVLLVRKHRDEYIRILQETTDGNEKKKKYENVRKSFHLNTLHTSHP